MCWYMNRLASCWSAWVGVDVGVDESWVGGSVSVTGLGGVGVICDVYITNYETMSGINTKITLRWRHNGCDSVSNHQPRGCLLNRLFRRKSKKTSNLCVTGLCAENSPGTGEFLAQMASNTDNVSIWWRHHEHPSDRSTYIIIFR